MQEKYVFLLVRALATSGQLADRAFGAQRTTDGASRRFNGRRFAPLHGPFGPMGALLGQGPSLGLGSLW